jgi:flavin reductase (DIM6/NTAB) family NADH-FMN oxidoreductase RutF
MALAEGALMIASIESPVPAGRAEAARRPRQAVEDLGRPRALLAFWDGERPQALLTTGLLGVEADPLRVLFSLPSDADALAALLNAGKCRAVLLKAREFKAHASGRPLAPQRFIRGPWRLDDGFAPRFVGGLAGFDLRIERWIRAGAHTIFLGQAFGADGQAVADIVQGGSWR